MYTVLVVMAVVVDMVKIADIIVIRVQAEMVEMDKQLLALVV